MKKLALIAIAVFAIVAMPATAAKSKATLAITPSSPQVGQLLVFSGCGYQPGQAVEVVVESPYATSFFGGDAQANGCFDTHTIGYTALQAGTYIAKSYQSNLHHADATLEFVVT